MRGRPQAGRRGIVLNRISMLVLIIALGAFSERISFAMGKEELHSIKDIQDSSWRALEGKRIFFGHQSVGSNIIDGLRDIMQNNKQPDLSLSDISDTARMESPGFIHARIGENGNAGSKFADFEKKMSAGIGGKADIALMKLCYVDISYSTDARAVFTEYKQMIDRLKRAYPKTTFIHVTSPLMVQDTGTVTTIKNVIKKVMNKPPSSASNMRREEYNELLRKEYQGKDPVFDLADLESKRENGESAGFEYQGTRYRSLAPEYTDDGGHLNERGRRRIAEQFLRMLVSQDKRQAN